MPLIANFERPDTEDRQARSDASQMLAIAFENVHRAVAIYESSREPHDKSVDVLLSEARRSFQRAGEAFSRIEASSKSYPRGTNMNLQFPNFNLRIGLFKDSLSRLSEARGYERIRSEKDLINAAVAVCDFSGHLVEYAGNSSDTKFEIHFRRTLIDLSLLHAFAVAMSEFFARLVKS